MNDLFCTHFAIKIDSVTSVSDQPHHTPSEIMV